MICLNRNKKGSLYGSACFVKNRLVFCLDEAWVFIVESIFGLLLEIRHGTSQQLEEGQFFLLNQE